MKKVILLSVLASTMIMAGGDIAPVEPAIETPMVLTPTDSGFYVGLGYGFVNEDYTRSVNGAQDAARSFDESFSSIMLQAGYKINSYVAIEGRYWAGLDDLSLAAYASAVDAPDAFGIYIKPMFPVTEELDVYALLGYATIDTSLNDLDGFSWGIGASYSFTENIAMFVDYVSLYDDDKSFTNAAGNVINKDYDIDTVNVGVTYRF